MNLRYIERDGQKVLQRCCQTLWNEERKQFIEIWDEIPTVQEPRKAREFWIEMSNSNKLEHRAFGHNDNMGIKFYGPKCPDVRDLIKVREVLDEK